MGKYKKMVDAQYMKMTNVVKTKNKLLIVY